MPPRGRRRGGPLAGGRGQRRVRGAERLSSSSRYSTLLSPVELRGRNRSPGRGGRLDATRGAAGAVLPREAEAERVRSVESPWLLIFRKEMWNWSAAGEGAAAGGHGCRAEEGNW